MDWGKIVVANAVSPALGFLEYEKQRKKAQKINEIDYKIRTMKVGATLDVERYTIRKNGPYKFDLMVHNSIVRQFTSSLLLVEYLKQMI
jgi:hypothetical protein